MTSKPGLTAELLAEFLGTFVLILFGTGVVAMVVLFPTKNPGEVIHGGFTNITLGWGLGVTMGIYIAGKISGAHLNPAVTLALAVFRKFPWSKVVPYSIAQTAGAFAAAALVYWNYSLAFRQVDPQLERTAGVFTTFPAFPEMPQAGFLDQLIGNPFREIDRDGKSHAVISARAGRDRARRGRHGDRAARRLAPG